MHSKIKKTDLSAGPLDENDLACPFGSISTHKGSPLGSRLLAAQEKTFRNRRFGPQVHSHSIYRGRLPSFRGEVIRFNCAQ
jgi:hypothetical protein